MESSKQQRETAEIHGGLALSLFALTMVVNESWLRILCLMFAGTLSLSSLYLIVPCKWKRDWFMENIADEKAKRVLTLLRWFAVLGAFAVSLVLRNTCWLRLSGIAVAFLALIILFFGFRKPKVNGVKGIGCPVLCRRKGIIV